MFVCSLVSFKDQKDDKYVVLVVDEFGGKGEFRFVGGGGSLVFLSQCCNVLPLLLYQQLTTFVFVVSLQFFPLRRFDTFSFFLYFFVANVLNFNVGDGVKFALPNIFWTRLSGKYGTKFYVRDNGIDLAITNAVEAIVSCLRSEDGYCTSPPEQAESMRGLGMR